MNFLEFQLQTVVRFLSAHPRCRTSKRLPEKQVFSQCISEKKGTIGRLDIIIAENILEYTAIKRGY